MCVRQRNDGKLQFGLNRVENILRFGQFEVDSVDFLSFKKWKFAYAFSFILFSLCDTAHLRATPLVRVKVKFTVKNAVCENLALTNDSK